MIKTKIELESDYGDNDISIITNVEEDYVYSSISIITGYGEIKHNLVIMEDLKNILNGLQKHIEYLENNNIYQFKNINSPISTVDNGE